MDCLQIDWADVAREDAFVRDEFYESIQAPKWIDFTAPLEPVDDHEWFGGNASGKDLAQAISLGTSENDLK
jgi:hypothetical protein